MCYTITIFFADSLTPIETLRKNFSPDVDEGQNNKNMRA